MTKRKLVVIGNGMAGIKCIEEIIAIAPDLYDITVFGSEPYPNYNRIMLSKILQGNASMDEITINTWEWYKENDIKLYVGTTVTKINARYKTIETNDGRKVTYDVLIIATGSSAFVPQLPGANKTGVTGFRNIDDCHAMMRAAGEYKRAAVIGGGLLGLEAAKGLLQLGMEVFVIHNAPFIMNRQLDQMAATMLRTELEGQGMRFLLNKRTERITGRGRVQGLLFDDGTKLSVDYVVFAVGIRPRIELADGSGLQTHHAFVVDDYMQTNLPDVYAVGECAEHNGIVYGLVAPLYEQGKVLARKLCGKPTEPYRGSIPSAQLKVSGIDVFSAGKAYDAAQETALQVYDGVKGTYKKVTMSNGKISGAILYGDNREANQLLTLIKKQASVSMLQQENTSDNNDAAVSLAPSDTVCSCNSVCKSVIVDAVRREGLETLEQVRTKTKASNSCGGCRPLVEAVIRQALESSEEEIEAVEPICHCTSLGHQDVIDEIASSSEFTVEGIMQKLGWHKPQGCHTCLAAIDYYLEIYGSRSSLLMRSSDDGVLQSVAIRVACQRNMPVNSITQDVMRLADRLEQALDALSMPSFVTLALSSGSSYPAGVMVSSFGITVTPAGWELYAGGNAEIPLRQAKLLALSSTIEEAYETIVSAVQWYRQSAYYGELVWEWLERMNIINVRELLLSPQRRDKLITASNIKHISLI